MRHRRAEHTQQQRPATSDQQQPQQPTTLLATLKRGAYTFVASLWPNYGHDARIAQALDNGQQEAVSIFFYAFRVTKHADNTCFIVGRLLIVDRSGILI